MLRRILRMAAALVVVLGWPMSLIAQETELKSRRSPVLQRCGYFERRPRSAAARAAELKFRTAQINDILKSLVFRLRRGTIARWGMPRTIRWTKALKSFAG